jgi:hypothetical protein
VRSVVLLCAPRDRSGRSAPPEVAPGSTPDSIQPKYAQMVAPTWITFLENGKRFHTAWVNNGSGMTRMGYRRFEKSAHRLVRNVATALARAPVDRRPTGSAARFLLTLAS